MAEGRDYKVGGYIARPLEAATSLNTDGLVLEIDASGDCILATSTGRVYGVASRSTQNKIQRIVGITAYDTGADKAGGISVMKSGIVELQLGSTNLAIKVGDRIVVHADNNGTVNGAVDEAVVADKYLTVGYAESVVALNAGGTVLVNLTIALGGAP